VPDVGVFRCTSEGVETDTPEFAVQADGVHLQVGAPGESSKLILRVADDPNTQFPVQWTGSDGVEFVTPFIFPGTFQAACEVSPGPDGPLIDPIEVHIVDPAGFFTELYLPCADTTETLYLVKEGFTERDDIPALIRTNVNGIEDDDEIVSGGYPESTEDIVYTVRRASDNVALIRAMNRGSNSVEAFDITYCDGSRIAEGQGVRSRG
jgi:hypothetical protein